MTSWPSCVLSAVSIDNIRSFLILPTYGRANSEVGVIIKLTLFHHTDMVKNSIILERTPPPPKNLLIGPASEKQDSKLVVASLSKMKAG